MTLGSGVLTGGGRVIRLLCLGILLAQEPTVRYSPAVEQLAGKLKIEQGYGPPGYGETPDRDHRVEVPILILRAPVRVIQDTAYDSDFVEQDHVTELQLSIAGDENTYRVLIGQQVLVKGTLHYPSTGIALRHLVMIVESIRPAMH